MARAVIGWRSRNRHRAIQIALAALTFVAPLNAQTAPSSAPTTQPTFDQITTEADSARRGGDSARASDLYTQALHLNPSWADGWWYLGQIRYGADDYAQAEDAFTRYLNLMPNAAPATALRGLCEFELGQYEPSLLDVQHALALGAADDSRNSQILRYHEGLLLTKLGRFEEALTSYGSFAHQHISNDELLVAVGLAALRIPEFPKDADAAQHAMSAQAGNAAFLLLSGDKTAAATAFQNFFQQYPAVPNLHYTLGYLLYPTDQDAAIAEFQRELTVDPASAIDHTMLAWALLMESSPAEALPEARKAAEEAPALPMAQLSLGRALLETGDTKTAVGILENALALDPKNLEIHIALARAYSESGREDDARRERLASLAIAQTSSKPAPAMGQQGASPAQ
ncbi:MAG TPA: tetratricopeptide repeat protein [Acidobacteriaceae bacterium]|jgi:tetratricopeptide (TPR) repeat protein